MFRVLKSYAASLRAARAIGAAERQERGGDWQGVLTSFQRALDALSAPGVDSSAPWTRSAASVALYGYCRAAAFLKAPQKLVTQVDAWRDRWTQWKADPATGEERECIEWVEKQYERCRRALN